MNFEKTRHLSADIMRLLKQVYIVQQVSALEKDLLKEKLRALYDAIDEPNQLVGDDVEINAFQTSNDQDYQEMPQTLVAEPEEQNPAEQILEEHSSLEPIAISLEDPMPWDHEKITDSSVLVSQEEFVQDKIEDEAFSLEKPQPVWQVIEQQELVITDQPIERNSTLDKQIEVIEKAAEPQKFVSEDLPSFADRMPSMDALSGIDEQEVEELFYIQEAKELSDKLSLSPISDLTKALGINDRLLTANDLFGGDYTFFDESFKKLNSLHSFEEAKQYLIENVVKDKDWLNPQKKEKAKRFIKFVKRRYIHVS